MLLFIVWLTLSNDFTVLCFLLFVEMHERSSAGQGSPCKYLLLSRPYYQFLSISEKIPFIEKTVWTFFLHNNVKQKFTKTILFFA